MSALLEEPQPLVACVAELHGVMDQMRADDWDVLDPSLVRVLMADLARLQSRIAAHQLRGAARLEATGAARRAGKTSTGDLLAGDFGGDRRAGDAFVRTSRQVDATSATQGELEAGTVSLGQAQVIGKALADVPVEKKALAEKALLRDAKTLSIKDLRRRADRVADTYADQTEADAAENENVEQRERRARAASRFRMWDNENGTSSGDFTIPEDAADFLKAALDAIAAPRRDHLSDDLTPTDSVHRMGVAFADLCRRLPTDGLPSAGGAGAVVTVNIDLEALQGQLKAATLATGTKMSAGQARQAACRAGIIPMVLGGTSLPLDLGRTQRLHSQPQRRAMARRDKGCTFPGCDRPPGWCEAHHIRAWLAGGTTTVADGALVCPFHHHVVHEQGWQLRIAPTDGVVEFRRPGDTSWLRNNRY